MTYALTLDQDGRVLSACVVIRDTNYGEMPIVSFLPKGELSEYRYANSEFIHDPLPTPEPEPPKPTQEERISALEAQLAAYETAYTEGVNEA